MRVMVIVVYLVLHSTRFWHYRFGVNLVVLACAVGGLSAISFAEGPLGLYVGVFGIAVLIGFVYFSGIYYGSTGHGDDQRGFAGGMHEATLGLGVAAGSVIGGLLGTFTGERSPYLLAIVVLLLLTALQIAVFRRRKRMPA